MPRLEVRDQPGLDLRIGREVVVQPVGKRLADLLAFRRGTLIFLLGEPGDLERPVYQVVGQRALAIDLGRPAQRTEIAVFDLPEIIFRLGIDEAKHTRGVGRPVDVWHAEGVAVNGDGFCQGRGPRRGRARRRIVGSCGRPPRRDEPNPGQGRQCERRKPRRRIRSFHGCMPLFEVMRQDIRARHPNRTTAWSVTNHLHFLLILVRRLAKCLSDRVRRR